MAKELTRHMARGAFATLPSRDHPISLVDVQAVGAAGSVRELHYGRTNSL